MRSLIPRRSQAFFRLPLTAVSAEKIRSRSRALRSPSRAGGSPDVSATVSAAPSKTAESKTINENRAGIERTLHRISCMRNRQSVINGLTCRVGRAVFGSINLIRDLLESGHSILILGKPGVGKTTIIREIARVLSEEMEKRVVIIDTSNEIAGDSDIPHSGIGRARRLQVSKSELQHQVMIEAVENHMPEVIIIDEIGTEYNFNSSNHCNISFR